MNESKSSAPDDKAPDDKVHANALLRQFVCHPLANIDDRERYKLECLFCMKLIPYVVYDGASLLWAIHQHNCERELRDDI